MESREYKRRIINDLRYYMQDDLVKLEDDKVYEINKVYYIKTGGAIILNEDKIFKIIGDDDLVGVGISLDEKLYKINMQLKIKPMKGSEVFTVEKERFKEIIETNNLHEAVTSFFISRLSEMSNHLEYFSSKETYTKVREAILHYSENLQFLEKKIAPYKFIIDLTGVSKSRVMHILSELKMGGYITIEGKSLSIHKKLPYGF